MQNAIYMLAASYIQMRDYDQAEKEALKLVKIKKNDGEIILDLIKKVEKNKLIAY